MGTDPRHATKLRLDLRIMPRCGGGMTDDELVAALCLRIGMIMEDVCADAVTVRPDDRPHLITVVWRLSGAAIQIYALAKAASVLLDGDLDAANTQ